MRGRWLAEPLGVSPRGSPSSPRAAARASTVFRSHHVGWFSNVDAGDVGEARGAAAVAPTEAEGGEGAAAGSEGAAEDARRDDEDTGEHDEAVLGDAAETDHGQRRVRCVREGAKERGNQGGETGEQRGEGGKGWGREATRFCGPCRAV